MTMPSQMNRLDISSRARGSKKDLPFIRRLHSSDVNELDRHADALGAALLMHHARAVGRHDVFGAGAGVIADLVVAHLRGDGFLEDREGAAEAATFVRPQRGDELD